MLHKTGAWPSSPGCCLCLLLACTQREWRERGGAARVLEVGATCAKRKYSGVHNMSHSLSPLTSARAGQRERGCSQQHAREKTGSLVHRRERESGRARDTGKSDDTSSKTHTAKPGSKARIIEPSAGGFYDRYVLLFAPR